MEPTPSSPDESPEVARSAALGRLVGDVARTVGFDAVAVASAAPLESELADLRAFLAEGRHGTMEWLARDPERRCDPRLVLPGCRSVVVVALHYRLEDSTERVDPPPSGKIARYARGRDYHRFFEKGLRKLARAIDAAAPGERSKPYVDYGPVLERTWAARAGLGFVGKHTLLIDPDRGSYLLLGAILTTALIPPTAVPDRRAGCGDCTRCLDACPTGAITEPWRFDARRCISYQTIENPDGPDVDPAGWLFGCDICQDVCPYNAKRSTPRGDDPLSGPERLPAAWSLAEILRLEESELEDRVRGTPLARAGAAKLRRMADRLTKPR